MGDDTDEFEPHYWIGRMYVDEPGHTSWEDSEDVSEEIAEALDVLNSPRFLSDRVDEAAEILEAVLDGVPEADRGDPGELERDPDAE